MLDSSYNSWSCASFSCSALASLCSSSSVSKAACVVFDVLEDEEDAGERVDPAEPEMAGEDTRVGCGDSAGVVMEA